MSGRDTRKYQIKQYIESLPGKRGVDIPDSVHKRIVQAAMGVTMPLWGRPPTPHQIQWLHDNGMTTYQQVQQAFGNLPHPHVDGMTVAQYQAWKQAHDTYKKSGGRIDGGP